MDLESIILGSDLMRCSSLSFQVSVRGGNRPRQREGLAQDHSCVFFAMICKPLAPAAEGLILPPPASPGGSILPFG